MKKSSLDYKIKAIENGFLIESSWTEKNDKDEFTSYKSKQYMYATWDEVTEWVHTNPLDMPPNN